MKSYKKWGYELSNACVLNGSKINWIHEAADLSILISIIHEAAMPVRGAANGVIDLVNRIANFHEAAMSLI